MAKPSIRGGGFGNSSKRGLVVIISRTPFRISFFGGCTDYPAWYNDHMGAVLATSINKYCYISCRYLPPFFEHKYRVVYSKIETVKDRMQIQHPVVRAAIELMKIDRGLEIHHDGDLPARTGLGPARRSRWARCMPCTHYSEKWCRNTNWPKTRSMSNKT